MPYVDLYSSDDYASIYYRTSSDYGHVSGFDPDKPTIMILHPMFLDCTWLECQFGDPRLCDNYNLIAFDMRTVGRSKCHPNPKHDSWTDAADIALCHQMLQLPPCHVLALEGLSVNCALRFAWLFPEMCLSLALCNPLAPQSQRWTQHAIQEIVHGWCFAEDLEQLEHSATELLNFFLGPNREVDLQDEVVAHWEKRGPPNKRPWIMETLSVLNNRTPMPAVAMSEIKQPVLLIHGERAEFSSRKHSEAIAAQLSSPDNEPIIYTVKGAATFLSVIPTSASIVNRAVKEFTSRLPLTRSELNPPAMPISERMELALKQLADLVGNKDVAQLDPMSSMSFSCLPTSVVKAQETLLKTYAKDRLYAFNPLGPDGKPKRKLSEGKDESWFEVGKDGLAVSVAATKFLPPEAAKKESAEKEKLRGLTEMVETKVVKTSIASANMVDKYLIKGPMAKVAREIPSAPKPLGRILPS